MTRGKYANRAALRREDREVTTTIETYKHSVARLTAENQDLKRQLADQRRLAAATERRLRAERDEGLSPKVAALETSLRAAMDGRTQAETLAKQAQERFHKWRAGLVRFFVGDLQMDIHTAQQAIYNLEAGRSLDDLFPVDDNEDRLLRQAPSDAAVQAVAATRSRRVALSRAHGPQIGPHR